MENIRRHSLIYGLLLAFWLLVVGWQIEEHVRVMRAGRTDLRNRSTEIANTVSAFVRALQFRGAVLQWRLEPVLHELANDSTNELVGPSELVSIALLNTNGEPIVSAGRPIPPEILQQGEHWGEKTVVFVNPIAGPNLRAEEETNPTVVLPPFRELSNSLHGGPPPPPGRPLPPPGPVGGSNEHAGLPDGPPPPHIEGRREPPARGAIGRPPPHRGPRDNRDFRHRPPPWLRGMNPAEYEALVSKRELHGLALAMSTATLRATALDDLWLRCIIVFFAGVSALGVALAWRNLAKSSELQIRLVRASELNTHLRELNLAAAGLAHETRNPLNIIRGLAQMIARQAEAPAETRGKSQAIVDEADKVTAQLNEFINYSRPREVRRTALSLNSAINEVARALNFDLEEKKVRLELRGEPLTIEADEQLLRQALFNLLLNAIQAVEVGGEIRVEAARQNASEAFLEIRDNGPGVPPERREEIFKPYFTTNQKGTGLGLAVVQQIVLAHGWEIECLDNPPHGALFRITHIKLAL